MSANATEDRITELESRLEFQDETIARLNDELVLQQQRVFQMDKTLQMLVNQFKAKVFEADNPMMDTQDEPPPPHY